MSFLKYLSILLLFLYGNSCFSFFHSNVENEHLEEVIEDAPKLTQTDVSLSDGVLSVPNKIANNSLGSSGIFYSFQFYSSFEEQRAVNYLPYSRKVSPSLDISAIIFPFHIFL